MEKILSIIIPTYNMEKYLRKCLDSLLIPSIDAVEILVVNDGSKDTSSAIAHEYAGKYPKSIIVIDKENGNYGSCINRGLAEATGKYIKVLDADDSFDNGNFEQYVQWLRDLDVDMALTDVSIVDEVGIVTDNKTFDIKPDTPITFNEICDTLVEKMLSMHSVTYKRSILRNIGYRQTEGISYTDQEWIYRPMLEVKSVCYFSRCIYIYLLGRTGQTMNNITKNIDQLMTVVRNMCSVYSEYVDSNALDSYAYKRYLHGQLYIQLNYIYYSGVVCRTYNIDKLREFDQIIHNVYPLVDRILGSLTGFSVKYVMLWRKLGVVSYLMNSLYRVRKNFQK